MNHFNLLPPETIEFIFKKLNLDDLINLRIVDKRFKQICDQIKIKQLCVSDNLCGGLQLFWFYINDPTYYKQENVIKFTKFRNYSTIFQLDKHLKRLALDIVNLNFSILNQFKLLEQLQITTDELIDNYKLSLDHLKIADFKFYDHSSFKLTLDTVKLSVYRLSKYSKDNVIFNYPDKILFFEIDYNNWQLLYDNLKCFNLQYLKINNLEAGSIDKDVLSKFKNLKILDLSTNGCSFMVNYNLVQDIKFLINEKEKLGRSEFEIYFDGVKLINQNKINQLKLVSNLAESRSNRLEFQIKNYDLLKDNCDTTKINYCDLFKLIKIIPSSFTNKFPFIYHVGANDHIDNEDQFIKFLNNLQHLSGLELINCKLTKPFYDQLIDSVYLNDLKILVIEEKNNLEMNFNFILHLKQLKNFQTNQIITNHIDLIYKLFKQNSPLFIFKFDSKNYIKILKLNSRFYIESYYYLGDRLETVYNFSIDLKNLDDVIPKLRELKF